MSNTLKIFDQSGAAKGDYSVNPAWLESEKGEQAVYEAVNAFLAGIRAGTACTKTRGEVSGSGAKPWKQKGTGNARVGSKRSPIWRGGGIVFGPKPRSYAQHINKKVKTLALRRALWQRVSAGDVIVVEDFSFPTISTKAANLFLKKIGAPNRSLVILNDNVDTVEGFEAVAKTWRSFNNIGGVDLVLASEVNTYEMLLGKKVVISKGAFETLGARLNKEA
ncbi:MAG: hypothetical protein RL095_2418 [Verrucomicrobiota bacterium]|jgi:large subunit ribosomal protein L4